MLRAWRSARGMSQLALATEAGVAEVRGALRVARRIETLFPATARSRTALEAVMRAEVD